jgi:putative ABC transport system permease protein
LSLLIGMPLAYWGMHRWLEQYRYHTGIHWWYFAVTAAGTLIITIIAVSFQTVKSALANPVASLRTEG